MCSYYGRIRQKTVDSSAYWTQEIIKITLTKRNKKSQNKTKVTRNPRPSNRGDCSPNHPPTRLVWLSQQRPKNPLAPIALPHPVIRPREHLHSLNECKQRIVISTISYPSYRARYRMVILFRLKQSGVT